MALTPEQSQNMQKDQSGLLNVTAKKYYEETLRPTFIKFNTTYHTDRELNRTITEVINRADSAICDGRYRDVEESYENMFSCINSKNYAISGPMRYGSDEEKKAVADLIEKISDFSMILKYEKDKEPEKHPIKERMNYQPPNGGFQGYNLDDISNRGHKENRERIPNPSNVKPKYAY